VEKYRLGEYSYLITRHHSWYAGFNSRSGHTKDIENGACSLSILVPGVMDGWV